VKSLSRILLFFCSVCLHAASADPTDAFSNGSVIEITGTVMRITEGGAVVRATGIVRKGHSEEPHSFESDLRKTTEARQARVAALRSKRAAAPAAPKPARSRGPEPTPEVKYAKTSRTILIVDLKEVAVEDPVKLKLYPTKEIKNGIRCFSVKPPDNP
jgi:hypothetical protein